MNDSNKLFDQISKELTQPGQLFETREYTNQDGYLNIEYANFPDNLKKYFEFGAMQGDKQYIV